MKRALEDKGAGWENLDTIPKICSALGKAKLLDIYSCLGKNKDTVGQGAPLTLATVFVFKLSSKIMGVTTG